MTITALYLQFPVKLVRYQPVQPGPHSQILCFESLLVPSNEGKG
jgi:hypothetical protein